MKIKNLLCVLALVAMAACTILLGGQGGCPDCTDLDADGFAIEGMACGPIDCDDTNPDVNPGADESSSGDPVCSDGIDNDCDGFIDAADPGCHVGIIADHNASAAFDLIPEAVIEQIGAGTSIFYGHTSHGSQIVSGMALLAAENSVFEYNGGAGTLQLVEYSDDLGHNGDVSWVPITRDRLGEPGNGFNVVIWSWCGGVTDNTVEGINTYLEAMDQLEEDYPDVTFVYMTGHLDGTGPDGNLYLRNDQIRDYCALNGKVLFDFADIESYDPDGNYYPDENDACDWCSDWCSTHGCPSCTCAHSHCFNCYRKGKAFWWMMARIAGWS